MGWAETPALRCSVSWVDRVKLPVLVLWPLPHSPQVPRRVRQLGEQFLAWPERGLGCRHPAQRVIPVTGKGYSPVRAFVLDGVVPEHSSFRPHKVTPEIGVHRHGQS